MPGERLRRSARAQALGALFALVCPLACLAGTDGAESCREWLSKGFVFRAPVAKLLAGDFLGHRATPPVDWACSNILDRSYCFRLHGFFALDPVLREYEAAPDGRCGGFLHDFVLDWVRANPTPLEGNEWAWHDDATARRVHRMSYCYKYLRSLWNEAELAEIKSSLDAQARLLVSDSFYSSRHNHGMYQDLALVSYSLCVCDDDAWRKACMDKAISRSLEYFDYAFCENGVHKEHSPAYGRDVALAAHAFAKLTEEYDPAASKRYEAHYRKARRFLVLCTMPDGKWPSVGDSAEVKAGYEPETASVFSDGEAGGGYAIFRSSWHDPPGAATWIMFQAATFGSAHKHSDDLSFILYHRGDLFVEAGNRDYNYLDPMTAYVYSGYAHNVMCADDADFPVKVGKNGFRSVLGDAFKTRITGSVLEGSVVSATGVQERFPGIVQRRTLSYDRIGRTVRVADEIETDHGFKASFLFHVAPGVSVEETGSGIRLLRNGSEIAEMRFSSDAPAKARVVAGEGEPPYRTWIFNGRRSPSHGSLVIFDVACKKGANFAEAEIRLK